MKNCGRQLRVVAVFAAILTGMRATPSLASDPALPSCGSAAAQAEARFGLPAGLLLAIGRVESGRRDPDTGAVAAWPWTINVDGTGRVFDTAVAAVAGTRALRDQGLRSIDVGCFQINLFHHPTAFASLEQAFDPTANASYAARFLVDLRQRLGTWAAAISAYHSSVPERGIPYRDRVLAGFSMAPEPQSPEPQPAMWAFKINEISWAPNRSTTVKVWVPSPSGRAPNVITITPAHSPGR